MKPGKSFATLLVLVSLLACGLPVGKAQGPCVGGMCRHGIARHRCLEVGCAPRSAFYNYYPTTWRRWPTDSSAEAPTPAEAAPEKQESSTTPDEQEAAPQVQPEQPGQPQITPEDDTIVPSEPTPGTTTPEPAPPLPADEEMLPFQDVPSSPAAPPSQEAPSGEVPPSQDAPPALPPDSITDPGLPGLPPSTTPTVPEEPPGGTPDSPEDAPPTMPEDPFKDDPVQPQTTPAAPTGMNESTGPELSSRIAPTSKSWRAALATAEPGTLAAPAVAKSLVPDKPRLAPSLLASYPSTDRVDMSPARAPEAAPQVSESNGPRLLPPGEKPSEELHRATLPHDAPARRNPLRTASMAMETGPVVVPAAAWTVDDAAKAGTGVKARRNPLRDR